MRQVIAGDLGHAAQGAGGDDDLVGLERGDEVDAGLGAKADVGAGFLHLAGQPVEQPLVGFIGQPGEANRAAEPRSAIEQRHLMAGGAQAAGAFHAAGTAADDHDMARRRRLRAAFEFPAQLGIYRAARLAAHVDRADAGVAVNAGAHLFALAAHQLVGQMRIGKQLAAHGNEIGLALADHRIAQFGLDPARGEDRNGDDFADFRCGGQVEAIDMRRVRFRMELALAGLVIGGDGDGIDAGLLDHLRRQLGGFDGDAVFLADFTRIELHPDGIIPPDLRPHCGDHFQQQAHAVFQAAAVLVGAGVGDRRDEGGQQIAMAGMDLHAVEAGFLRPARTSCELAYGKVDVGLFQHFDRRRLHPRHPGEFFHQEVFGEIALGRRWQGRSPQRMAPAGMAIGGDQPAVVQLRRDLCPSGVDPVAQLRQAGDEAILRNRRLLHGDAADRPGYPGHARDDQPGAAPCLLFMIGDDLFADRAVVLGQADPHGGDRDAVLELERADPAGGEQVGVSVGNHGRSCAAISAAADDCVGEALHVVELVL